jgi:hypothetical protein
LATAFHPRSRRAQGRDTAHHSDEALMLRYEIVLDVPQDSVAVAFGFFLFGGGEVWADDFKLERVPDTTPLTGKRGTKPRSPVNLDFEAN